MNRPVFRWRLAAACALHTALALAAPALHAQPTPPLGADLAGLLEHARRSNPEFGAMQREADAAGQRVRPAGALPEPVLRVELENIGNAEARRENKYTLMQPLPAWGKRGLREQAAAADARQAQARAAAAWNEVAARIKSAYAQYYQAAGNERLARELLDLMVRLEQIAQARYAGGLVPQQDAIRAQLEQTAMRSELIALEAEKAQLRARLNALLARGTSEPLAEPHALAPMPAPELLRTDALRQRALESNPLLQAERARVEAAEKTRDLTWRNRYPDFSVGVSPIQMGSRVVSWGVMVELNIPLQQGVRRSQESEAGAMLAAARSRAEATANQITGDLAEQLAALQAARSTESLLRTHLLPQSELGLHSALAAYENGKADFATLLDAQRAIRKARQDLLKAQAEARQRLAEIERIVGEEL
ncbi:MAG: TolC family protein [Pseudomonadota bacterium]